MKKIRFLIIILLISFLQSCKKEKISDIYNKCYSENVTVNGKSIKHFIKGFEEELIKSNLLKDSTGKSYRDFFFELSNYDYIYLNSEYSFSDSIRGAEFDKVLSCPKKIRNHKDFESSIFGRLEQYMKNNNGNHEGFFESQPVKSTFNEKTFEYDYIKHKLFNVIKVYDKNKNVQGKVLCKSENCPKRKETL